MPSAARFRAAALLAALALAAACASSSGSSRPRGARHPHDAISAEELRTSPFHTAYEIVASLHPAWLTGRGSSFDGPFVVRVIFDDQPYGDAEQLRAIPTMSISSIRWVDGPTASGRWGLGYQGGAVVLTSLKE